jgi:hypothetical protein
MQGISEAIAMCTAALHACSCEEASLRQLVKYSDSSAISRRKAKALKSTLAKLKFSTLNFQADRNQLMNKHFLD